MTYSLDFRKKVLEIKERDKLSFEAVALRFGVGKNTIFCWTKQLEPCTSRNKPSTKINMDALARDVELYPDAYQFERAERLGVSKSCIQASLKRLKHSRKKNAEPSESQCGVKASL